MKKLLSAVIAIGTLAAFTMSSDAFARDRIHTGGYATGKGKTGTYSTATSGNLKEGLTKTKTVTNAQGKTITYSGKTQYDRQTGAFTKSVTGQNGKSVTYTGTAKDGQRSGTYATSNGKTGNFNQSVTKNDNGGVTRDTTVTTSEGKTVSGSSTAQYDKETGTITATGPKGNTGSVTLTPDKPQ